MDQTGLAAIVAAAIVGVVAVGAILRRYGRDSARAHEDSPYATSTEGMKLCPRCDRANLVTDDTCSYCGARLPG